jgi:CBS domain-containing protein
MQHHDLVRSSIAYEPIPILPAQVGQLDSRQTDSGAARADGMIEWPLTVRTNTRAGSAIALMRDASTSAALVTHALRDGRYDRVVGLVTSHSLQRQLLAVWEPEIVVGDEMVPWEELSIVHAASVQTQTRYQLYDMFRGSGLSHVVVVDDAEDSYTFVIGLLSRAALAAHLGLLVHRSRQPH